ncbi:DUF979 domain-containing protein [Luteimonas sp. RD2P54]|uniref:DUF979 domain-containing protein n=1 Tax=Luteimonas endophytica TaxID=3042023 RepID=A0ABT6JCH9_9GAMM|nr:DUF979 domain-containing protein [Luteimonas endophytica]MDH5824270.1 DUF979 domain-containing protein [Luteimonas endophytica]
MITLQWVYWLTGLYLAAVAVLGWRDRGNPRRRTTALFWGLLAAMLLFAERLPGAVVGAVVVALAMLAGFGGLGRGRYRESSPEEKRSEARRLGNRLFWPALLIPLVTVLVAVVLADVEIAGLRLFGAELTTLVGLGVACVLAVAAACRLTRQSPVSAVEQSRRLIDAIGWAALLPLLLATLGSVFAAAGVGEAVAGVVGAVIPVENRFVVVLAYALGMALFTMIMGNAFAAFPVMTGGIALPLLVGVHGADAASLAAIGMLSGYCGTLLTPMAANFNLVPAALLELKDPYAVIRQQVATALPLLACNVLLMYFIVFR